MIFRGRLRVGVPVEPGVVVESDGRRSSEWGGVLKTVLLTVAVSDRGRVEARWNSRIGDMWTAPRGQVVSPWAHKPSSITRNRPGTKPTGKGHVGRGRKKVE